MAQTEEEASSTPVEPGAQDAPSGPRRRRSLRQAIEHALETGGERAVRRMSSANTSVTLRCPDRPGEGATLLLDRRPPAVVGEEQPAEIVIELSGEQYDRLVAGELLLPTALYHGDLAYRGPVRKFMAVAPVLRALLSGSTAVQPPGAVDEGV